MNITPETLDDWGDFAETVRREALNIGKLIGRGEIVQAREALLALHFRAAAVTVQMQAAGAQRPDYEQTDQAPAILREAFPEWGE